MCPVCFVTHVPGRTGLLDAPLRLWRTHAAKNSCHAKILIDLRPMNTFAFANQLPVISLISGGVKQSWIPDERRGYSATIDEMNRQFVIGHDNLHGARFRFNYESAHSTPPKSRHAYLERCARPRATRARQIVLNQQ